MKKLRVDMRGLLDGLQTSDHDPMRYYLDLDTGEVLDILGGCRIIHTPGHTPGGCCLYLERERKVITGDTLFADGVGRTDFPGSSHESLIEGIRNKLFTLPEPTLVYPGHGPSSTIGHEKLNNPYVRGI